ncbi:MAG: alanine racemase [Chromatiales bacterium]|jgi:alanine racemase|nr:MAG: alanine racemase [Chromatiales bacterium]
MNRRKLLQSSLTLPIAAAAAGCQTLGGTSSAAASAGLSTRDSHFDPWIEINADNVRHNVREISRRVSNRPILAVIKNNGYGAGTVEIARILEPMKSIAGFAVIKLQEAMVLRDAGIRKPILLMGPFNAAELDDMVARNIMAMMYRPMGTEIGLVSARRQKPVTVHFCIDTGIGRVGVPYQDAEDLVVSLGTRKDVVVAGTQMTFAEDPEFDAEQLRRFVELCGALERRGVSVGRRHAASSFALFERPEAFLDMVRPGMAIYGCYSEARFRDLKVMDLRPSIALKTRVVYVKRLRAGDSAGYERAYKTDVPVWLATLPVGHVDGLPRNLAGGGSVRIRDRMYPLVASVSSSHSIVELGAGTTVKVGDEVTLFGWQTGSEPNSLCTAAKCSVYDLMMHLNPLLPRRVVSVGS